MLNYFSNLRFYLEFAKRCLAALIILTMFSPVMPVERSFAQEAGGDQPAGETSTSTPPAAKAPATDEGTASSTDETSGEDTTTPPAEDTSTSTEDNGEPAASSTPPATDEGTASTTDETASSTDSTNDGTSTGDGTSGTDGGTETDGTQGTTTASTTPGSNDGTEGAPGTDGGTAPPATGAEATPEDEGEPVLVFSETELGDDDASDDEEEITGSVVRSGGNVSIDTGPASAQGELFSDVNSTDVQSLIDGDFTGDLDFYTFNATGTNEAIIENIGATLALTGENSAFSRGVSNIETGEAIAAFNLANVVNSNVVNSDGFLFLKNQILKGTSSLDLRDLFFPDPDGLLADAEDCDLLSCVAEDVVYNFSQTSHATITNDVRIESVTGVNYADGEYSLIDTGNAYGGANVINVVNTNIVDSNYRLLTYNAIGDLKGDLMLPREELFRAFYGRPNGVTQLRLGEGDDITKTIENDNDADVNNNVISYAQTGLNLGYTADDTDITTGNGASESNILNKINENTFGGDSMYLLIRIHGSWSGDVKGLPDGLTWQWTPDGVLIYNEDAEIAPSKLLPYDIDSYNANLKSYNRVRIDNNVKIDAITGENEIVGGAGFITTGDAVASANVMNLANTNIIGTNFTMAVVNIFGDFDGDVTFTETNLGVSGALAAADNPLQPGSDLTYTYTVTNAGTELAPNVRLTQTLSKAFVTGTDNVQEATLGDLAPGESKTVVMSAFVDPTLATGTHTVTAVARVRSDAGDATEGDDVFRINRTVTVDDTSGGDDTATGTGTDGGVELGDETGSTTDDGTTTGTTTDTTTDTTNDTTSTDTSNQTNTSGGGGGGSSGGGGGGSGGGGGGSSSKTKSIERAEVLGVDADDASFLVINKTAEVAEGSSVKAGEYVDYTITVTNRGGTAYDAVVYDTLENPIGAVLSEQSWELGTILPKEEIKIQYTTHYDVKTPSGVYTNKAYVEAYKEEDAKAAGEEPLKLDSAEYALEIDGVPLAVGNVMPIVYYPGSNGRVNALITWETSQPALAQVFYSPSWYYSPYKSYLPNFGYLKSSFTFSTKKTTHYMILTDLWPGQNYKYRIRATIDGYAASGGDYTLSVPPVVNKLTLAIPTQPAQVAGATQSAPAPTAPVSTPTPAPMTTANFSQPTPTPTPAAAPEPESDPEPEPTPDPEPAAADEQNSAGVGGFVKKAANSVFGLFGW